MRTIEPLTHAKGSSQPKTRWFMAFCHRATGALKIAINNPTRNIANPISISDIEGNSNGEQVLALLAANMRALPYQSLIVSSGLRAADQNNPVN